MSAYAVDGWVVREGPDGYLLYAGSIPPDWMVDMHLGSTDKVIKVRLMWEEED